MCSAKFALALRWLQSLRAWVQLRPPDSCDAFWVRPTALRPRDQTQFVHLHQAGMRRHYTHAKAVGATFRRGDRSLVDIIPISIRASALIEQGRRRIANVTIVDFAVVGFHSHMLWIDGTEMNSRCNFQ